MSALSLTGIGGVPFHSEAAALNFVFEVCPELPYVPELTAPKSFLALPFAAFAESLSIDERGGLRIAADVCQYLEQDDGKRSLPHTLAELIGDRRTRDAIGVKGQCVGPATLVRYCAVGGDGVGRETALVEYLERYLAAYTLALTEGHRNVWMFLDEPGFLDGADLPLVMRALEIVRRRGARVGLHCCNSSSVDMLCSIKPDLLSLDISRIKPADAVRLSAFIADGGFLAAGIPRTLSTAEAAALLQAVKPATSPDLLGKVILTPPCGLSLVTECEARAVFGHLATIARDLRE